LENNPLCIAFCQKERKKEKKNYLSFLKHAYLIPKNNLTKKEKKKSQEEKDLKKEHN